MTTVSVGLPTSLVEARGSTSLRDRQFRMRLPPRAGALARAREQRRLVAPADALGDLVGVVGTGGVAALMGEAQVVEPVCPVARPDLLDPGALVVAARQVEPHRAPAAAAVVAVALPKRVEPLLLLLLEPKLPRVEVENDRVARHHSHPSAVPFRNG